MQLAITFVFLIILQTATYCITFSFLMIPEYTLCHDQGSVPHKETVKSGHLICWPGSRQLIRCHFKNQNEIGGLQSTESPC